MKEKYCEIHENIKPYTLVPATVISEDDPPFKLCSECYHKYLSRYEHLLGLEVKLRV